LEEGTAASTSRDISARSAREPTGPVWAAADASAQLLPVVIFRYIALVTALNAALYATAIVLALRRAEAPPVISRMILVVVVAGSAVIISLVAVTNMNVGVSDLWVALVLLGGVVMIVHRVLLFGTVTLDSMRLTPRTEPNLVCLPDGGPAALNGTKVLRMDDREPCTNQADQPDAKQRR
jgi:hypothetical protein